MIWKQTAAGSGVCGPNTNFQSELTYLKQRTYEQKKKKNNKRRRNVNKQEGRERERRDNKERSRRNVHEPKIIDQKFYVFFFQWFVCCPKQGIQKQRYEVDLAELTGRAG